MYIQLRNSIHQNLARVFLKDVASTMTRSFDARVASLRRSSSSLSSSSFSSPSDFPFSERRTGKEDKERKKKNMVIAMETKKEGFSAVEEVLERKATGEVYVERGEKAEETPVESLAASSSSSSYSETEREKKQHREKLADRPQRDSSSSSPLFSSSSSSFSPPSSSSSSSFREHIASLLLPVPGHSSLSAPPPELSVNLFMGGGAGAMPFSTLTECSAVLDRATRLSGRKKEKLVQTPPPSTPPPLAFLYTPRSLSLPPAVALAESSLISCKESPTSVKDLPDSLSASSF